MSQSRIKRINDELFCPLKFLKCDVLKEYQEIPTESMKRGQLFEYLAFGSLNREGQVPVLTKTSRGKMTAEEKRIILQASEMKRVLALNGITVLATCVPLTVEWKPKLWLTMLFDAFVYWDRSRDPDPENNQRSGYYVFDAKLTANIHSSYGRYCWGTPWNMDHLQSHVYREGAQRVLTSHGRRREIGFVYGVFDYSTRMEHKLVEIRPSANNAAETSEQIRKATGRLEDANDEDWPAVPHFHQCKTCPVPDCTRRVSVPAVQVVN